MQNIAGPGMPLPPPTQLYPVSLTNNPPYSSNTNEVALAPGQGVQIPAGKWSVDLGKYSVLQYNDPVWGTWRIIRTGRGTPIQVQSDGQNYRVINLLGCAVAAVVTNGGSNYVQATTTVKPSTGSSTWQPIVGGQLGAFSLVSTGSGYGLAPEVYVDAPPTPGVQATAYATLSGTTVGSITLSNVGAGYPFIPNVTIVPSPFDPNIGTITNATAVASLSNAGKLTAVLCTNHGAPVANTMTLTVAGAGMTAAVTPQFLQTVSVVSINTAGSGTVTAGELTSIGGNVTSTTTYTNPICEYTDFIPRPYLANISFTSTGGVTVASANGTIDQGMFLTSGSVSNVTPLVLIGDGRTFGSPVPAIVLNLGSTQDIVAIQPM